MILFQDTDSLCKLYLTDEVGTDQTRRLVSMADSTSASALAYAEVRGVLARARRARRIRSIREHIRLRDEFETDWPTYVRVPVSEGLISLAGDLAERHSLTGVDAIHLASAMFLSGARRDLQFSTWDHRLSEAAEAEGLSLAHEVTN